MKNNTITQKQDRFIALLFLVLTLLFIAFSLTSPSFFDWVFTRHQNPWSWYIRPLFLIPFCYFAYKHSWSGVSITVFCLFTSMFWFNQPNVVSEQVKTFLAFEKEWLTGSWTVSKLFLACTIPISFFLLGLAFWKRSLLLGISVLIMMATGKMIWSVQNAGESGKSIFVPAIVGLTLCIVILYFGFKRLEKKN